MLIKRSCLAAAFGTTKFIGVTLCCGTHDLYVQKSRLCPINLSLFMDVNTQFRELPLKVSSWRCRVVWFSAAERSPKILHERSIWYMNGDCSKTFTHVIFP